LVELKNQADSLFYSYDTTIKDNKDLISQILQAQELQAQANEKRKQITAALVDASINKVEEVKQQIDDFQQTLLAIGNLIYTYANAHQSSDLEEGTIDDDSTAIPEFNNSSQPTPDDEENLFNFDEETVTADYEAVDAD
jgi:molecular chaperone DnaK